MASFDAVIIDEAALRKTTPQLLESYLRAHGWEKNENEVGVSFRKGDSIISVTGLQSRPFRYVDYASCALRQLSAIEKRSELDIYAEIIEEPTAECLLDEAITVLQEMGCPLDYLDECPHEYKPGETCYEIGLTGLCRKIWRKKLEDRVKERWEKENKN